MSNSSNQLNEEEILHEWCLIEDLIFDGSEENLEKAKNLIQQNTKMFLLPALFCTKKAIKYRILKYSSLFSFFNEINKIDPEISTNFRILDPNEFLSFHLANEKSTLTDIIISDDLDRFTFYTSSLNLKTTWIRLKYNSYHCLDFSALCGSLYIFKYLIVTEEDIPNPLIDCAIMGGNEEILQLLEQKGLSFNYKFSLASEYHHNDISKWLLENYKQHIIHFNELIANYNTSLFMELKETEETSFNKFRKTDLILASLHSGNIPLFSYLLTNNIENVDEYAINLIRNNKIAIEHKIFLEILNNALQKRNPN